MCLIRVPILPEQYWRRFFTDIAHTNSIYFKRMLGRIKVGARHLCSLPQFWQWHGGYLGLGELRHRAKGAAGLQSPGILLM